MIRKANIDPDTFGGSAASSLSSADLAKYLTGNEADEIWELWLASSKTSFVIDQCISSTEPAYLAKHVFQLAQLFNTFYHRHPILSEPDEKRKHFLLATVAVVRRELIRVVRRGGRVRLILAGKTDVLLSQVAAHRLYQSLLRAGVDICLNLLTFSLPSNFCVLG